MQQFQVTLYNAAAINTNSVVVTARDNDIARGSAHPDVGMRLVCNVLLV